MLCSQFLKYVRSQDRACLSKTAKVINAPNFLIVYKVFEVNRPREEVLRGELKLEEFGIEFSHVIRGVAPPVYRDPVEFFRKTYFTEALKDLVVNVLRRVAGFGGSSIFVFDTGFGGGKTHALLSVYHLFKGKNTELKNRVKDVDDVKQLLREAGIGEIPDVNVVAIDCKELDPTNTPKTLWGEIARQMGRYDVLAYKDQNFIAPTESEIAQVLGSEKPAVILIDEIGEYFGRVLGAFSNDYQIKFEQIRRFFRSLESAIVNPENSHVLIVTLATEAPYHPAVASLLNDIRDILGRHGRVTLPIRGDEIYHVVKKKLFEFIDEKAAYAVASKFREYYQKNSDSFPGKVIEGEGIKYSERIIKAYPFHPELIDILYERVGTIPGFQKTRGVFRLLALIIRDVWMNKPADAYLIMPKHVNLSNSTILDELTSRLDRSSLITVVRSDIESREGTGKAQKYGDPLYLDVARSVFLYSLIGTQKQLREVAATVKDIALSVATPDLSDPGYVAEVLRELSHRLWYLYTDDGTRYWFDVEPNINKIIDETKNSISVTDAANRIRQELQVRLCREFSKNFKNSKCIVWDDPSDDPELKIVILDPYKYYISDYRGGEVEVPAGVGEIFNRLKYKNTVIFLLPLRNRIDMAIEDARYVIACEYLEKRGSFDKYKSIINERRGAFIAELITKLIDAYQIVIYPHASGLRTAIIRLQRSFTGKEEDLAVLARSVRETLVNMGKIVDNLSHEYLWDRYFEEKDEFKRNGEINIERVLEDFKIDQRLPIVSEDSVIRAITKLIEDGKIAYRSGDKFILNYESENLKDIKDVVIHARNLSSNYKDISDLLREFELKVVKSGEVRRGEENYVISLNKAKELVMPYIERLKEAVEKNQLSIIETKVSEEVAMIDNDRVNEFGEGVVEEINVNSTSAIYLRNVIRPILEFLNVKVGFDARVNARIYHGEAFEVSVSSTHPIKELDALSTFLADIEEIYDILKKRYGNVSCESSLVISNLSKPVDRKTAELIKKYLESVRSNAKFTIRLRKIQS